jgi:chorismate lyase/3-hydroxybenzoate synthase
MLPTWPELIAVETLPADNVLGVVAFGSGGHADLMVPVRQLGSAPLAEVWRSTLPIERSRSGGVALATNGEILFGTATAEPGDTECVTAKLYEEIVDAVRTAGYPHLLRAWNHVGSINEPEHEIERYKRFSAGRHEALTGRGYVREQFPAASAVGMNQSGVRVYFVASRNPGEQVENPRQVAAYDYPAVYGSRSPSFARATVTQWNGAGLVFVAGTASVVGHETRHAGDIEAQLEETLLNLETIIGEAASRIGRSGSLDNMSIAKTYIRNASDYELIAARLKVALPRTQLLFIESDICRRNLLVEIEGVAKI